MARPLGITSLQILAAVRDGSRYGLDIVGHTGLASGTVYPTLSRLEERGQLRSSWEDEAIAEAEGRPRRRYYELTPEGGAALGRGLERVRAVSRRLAPGGGET